MKRGRGASLWDIYVTEVSLEMVVSTNGWSVGKVKVFIFIALQSNGWVLCPSHPAYQKWKWPLQLCWGGVFALLKAQGKAKFLLGNRSSVRISVGKCSHFSTLEKKEINCWVLCTSLSKVSFISCTWSALKSDACWGQSLDQSVYLCERDK